MVVFGFISQKSMVLKTMWLALLIPYFLASLKNGYITYFKNFESNRRKPGHRPALV